jgi:PDZ domain/Activator of Hsp90 ATPase homolog 1-like protein
MQERDRDDGFEATFVVSTPRAQAWEWLESATPASDALPPPEPGQWWIPAIEGPAEAREVVPEKLLRCEKVAEPCRGTEIVITMEDEASGTRITIVQNGFGAGFAEQRPWLAAGWYSILADFVVFFEHGIALGRHLTWWWALGCVVIETDAGLKIGEVNPEGFAAAAGLQRDDLIVTLAGTPVVNVRDLSILLRGPLHTGVETKVRYLRGTEVRSATGVI